MSLQGQGRGGEAGYAMAALLVALAVMGVTMTVALPVWKTMVQREKEAELIFRGQQYARAIVLFQRKYANTFPPNVEALLSGRFLRRKYLDPMTNGEFQVLYGSAQQTPAPQGGGAPPRPGQGGTPGQTGGQGQPVALRPGTGAVNPPRAAGQPGPVGASQGMVGVTSKSTATSLRVYNGRTKYNEWAFIAQDVTQRPGSPGGAPRTGGVGGQPPPSRPGLPLARPPASPSPTFPRRP